MSKTNPILQSVGVRLEHVTKKFSGGVIAVNDVSFSVPAGQLVTLLGPSGCGKTTTLRLIAGLEQVDDGAIYLGERAVTNLPPHERGIGMVFQSYALFPHMTVYENIAYGLEIAHAAREQIDDDVRWALELVNLTGLAKRYPAQLSGGQQQRVALARALVLRPQVLLLDEPLSNLDAKLRKQMREEIRTLQTELHATTIYVTHDQSEALAISDTVVLMRQGVIEQMGTPTELYERPRSRFVADFVGETNFLPARVLGADATQLTVQVLGHVATIPRPAWYNDERTLDVICRPEALAVLAADDAAGWWQGCIATLIYQGAVTDCVVHAHDLALRCQITGNAAHTIRVGDAVRLAPKPASLHAVQP
jgi:iron(III) transport system ATP-binding protein